MKILFCIGTLMNGGAERVICTLANNFVKNNDVKIISITKTRIAYNLDKRINVEFIDKKDFDNKIPKKNRISKNIRRLFVLRKSINVFKPDIIISFTPEPSFLILMLKKMNRIPTIISVRNDPKIEYSSRIYNFLMKKLYPKADGIVFQTNEAMQYFDNITNNYKMVIPNPIKNDFICNRFNGKRRKIIVNVGRLQEQKNQELLIRAFNKLDNKFNDYKLIIYGEGILKDYLNNLIRKFNLENRVVLAGISNNIKEEIYDASLFVLSSEYEGMPNALMEAMALGLPVVSTDCPCGGPAFLIKNDYNGILVENNNVEKMYKAMVKVLESESFANKIGENANKIKESFSEKIIVKKWEEFIINIMSKE